LKKRGASIFAKGGSDSCIWHDSAKLTTVLFYEFLGTSFIVLTYTLSNNDELARAMGYFILFVLFFHVTGAHFNPATSFADYLYSHFSGKYPQLIDRKNALKLLLLTFLIQILGSLFGLLLTYLLAKYYI